MTSCDLRLPLGITVTERGESAEQNSAWHSIGDVRALISLGGLADGRLSETFDAALDESSRKERQRQRCAELPALVFTLCSRCVRNEAAGVFLHGKSD